jgi:hypothetical protein
MTEYADELLEKARLKLVQTIGEISEDTDVFTALTLAEVRIRRLQSELDGYYYVAREYSHTDKRRLWSIVSRRITYREDAESWAEFQQSFEPKHRFFVVFTREHEPYDP